MNVIQLDYNIFLLFNSLAGRNFFWDNVFVFLAVDLAIVEGIVLFLYWFGAKDRLRARKAMFVTFFSFVLSRGVITEIVRALVPRNRPFVAHQVTELINKGNEASFNSGHSAAMFAIALGIYYYDKNMGVALFILAILTGLARVIIGVHYPSDIIAGVIVGLFSAWLIRKTIGNSKWADRATRYISNLSDRIFPFTKLK